MRVPAPTGTILVDPRAITVEGPPPVVDADALAAAADASDAGPADAGEGDGADTEDGADADAASADADAADTSDVGPTIVEIPAAWLARIREDVPESARARARDLNRSGLRKHRRLDLPAAITDYEAALEAWGAHPFSHYNLACAFALTGKPEEALLHLAILDAIGGEEARGRLAAARTDRDFTALLGDPRFRELTGYVPVVVTWPSGSERRDEATRVVESLRKRDIPARLGDGQWRDAVASPTILSRAGDPLASAMVREIGEIVSGVATKAVTDPRLDDQAPVVIVLPGAPGADAGEEEVADTPPPPPDAAAAPLPDEGGVAVPVHGTALADFLGPRLGAKLPDGTVARLQLKPTGFFSWELTEPTGRRVARSGRYTVQGGRLALSYTERVETPGDDPRAPEIAVHDGRESSHSLEVEPDGLKVDGVHYGGGL